MKVYNSRTKKLEFFVPLDKTTVKMYVCGITPYDVTHLGHAATYVFFDVLRRHLVFQGYDVRYTQNVTDVDDDILKRSKATGTDWRSLGRHWTNFFLEDMKTLNVIPPTAYVRATDYIAQMIEITQTLFHKGLAYEASGTVYFDTTKFPQHGRLSGYSRTQMIGLSKERGADPGDPNKKDPLDFILWQKSEAHEPSWKSPWGPGRPGWHIECSALIQETLGPQIDIHGGGLDLIYPHHESEIAQSESYTGKNPFVKYWLHTAMVMHLGEKMSKSLGNLVLVRELLRTYSPDAIRWYLLSHHYRDPWEFDEQQLKKAQQDVDFISTRDAPITRRGEGSPWNKSSISQFLSLMDNDLDTPSALKLMQGLGGRGESHGTTTIAKTLGFTFRSV